jgi:hypothetical protein
MRVDMALKDLGVRKNGTKVHVVQEYSLAHPKTKL